MDHLSHAALGRSMDALESPSEESRPIRGSVACGKGKVPKKVKGGVAYAPSDFNAEWKESVTLGSGSWQPFGVFLHSSLIIRGPRCLGTLDTITG
jgi:hypothetical protein